MGHKKGLKNFYKSLRPKWLPEERRLTNYLPRIAMRFLVGIPYAGGERLPFCLCPFAYGLPVVTERSEEERNATSTGLWEQFLRVQAWESELRSNPELRRADIARREGLTRARVTQLLAIAELSPDIVRMMLAGDPRLSLRDLIRATAAEANALKERSV